MAGVAAITCKRIIELGRLHGLLAQNGQDFFGHSVDDIENFFHSPCTPRTRIFHGPFFFDLGFVKIASFTAIPDFIIDFAYLVGHLGGEVNGAALTDQNLDRVQQVRIPRALGQF
jgi:hypothetical protein